MNRSRAGAACTVFVAAMLPPAAVLAQSIHKCVSGGSVSYQSDPCPRDDRVVDVWQSTPTAQDASAAAARTQAAQQRVAADVAASTPRSVAPRPSAPASGPTQPRHHR